MKKFVILLFVSISFANCKSKDTDQNPSKKNNIVCSSKNCIGEYVGPEFVNGADVAHQFSNAMCASVGDQLKSLYRNKIYSKVNFGKIKMSTAGMGTGTVTYQLTIPFVAVKEKCDAYTSFDHVGGWNHVPARDQREKELSRLLLKGEKLEFSSLKKTKEGLQEYWIQWKNKELQKDCG